MHEILLGGMAIVVSKDQSLVSTVVLSLAEMLVVLHIGYATQFVIAFAF